MRTVQPSRRRRNVARDELPDHAATSCRAAALGSAVAFWKRSTNPGRRRPRCSHGLVALAHDAIDRFLALNEHDCLGRAGRRCGGLTASSRGSGASMRRWPTSWRARWNADQVGPAFRSGTRPMASMSGGTSLAADHGDQGREPEPLLPLDAWKSRRPRSTPSSPRMPPT